VLNKEKLQKCLNLIENEDLSGCLSLYSTDLEEKANAWPTEFDASLLNSTINLNLGDFSCGADHCLESYKNVTKGIILFLEFMSEPELKLMTRS